MKRQGQLTPEQSRKFFALPLATKLLAPHPPGGMHHRGYSSPGMEKVTQAPDYKESFDSGNPLDSTMQPNIWLPDTHLPGFRAFMESHFATCASLIHALLDALSLALGVPPPGLAPTHAANAFQLRLLHYPPVRAADLRERRTERIGKHSDFGTLTLLFQDAVGGLKVQRPGAEAEAEDEAEGEGAFVDVPPVRDAVLVNVGDLMARWSNGRWRSTVHRVGLPAGHNSSDDGEAARGARGEAETQDVVPERFSVPFFATADMDTVIEALPGCWGEGRPKLYEPVTAWEYVQMRMAALYE